MAYLNFISDEKLEILVQTLLQKGEDALNVDEKKFNKNTIDPFSLLFEMASFNMNFDDWKQGELRRQAQKSLSNHVGDFHQEFLGQLSGWQNLGICNILDLVNEEQKICAEIKNKHNTLNASGLVSLYDNLEKEVMDKNTKYKGFTAYYVQIIPSSSTRFNRPFMPSDKAKGRAKPENPLIREIDGASFYALATGEENALENLFKVLPKVIAKLKPNLSTLELQKSMPYFETAFKISIKQRPM